MNREVSKLRSCIDKHEALIASPRRSTCEGQPVSAIDFCEVSECNIEVVRRSRGKKWVGNRNVVKIFNEEVSSMKALKSIPDAHKLKELDNEYVSHAREHLRFLLDTRASSVRGNYRYRELMKKERPLVMSILDDLERRYTRLQQASSMWVSLGLLRSILENTASGKCRAEAGLRS